MAEDGARLAGRSRDPAFRARTDAGPGSGRSGDGIGDGWFAGGVRPAAGSVDDPDPRLAAGDVDAGLAVGSDGNRHQRLVRGRMRRIADFAGDGAGLGRDADQDPAAGDLDGARRNGTGQCDHRRFPALGEAVRHRERGVPPRVGVGALATGIDVGIADMAGRFPAGRVLVGGLDGLFQRFFQGVRLDGNGVRDMAHVRTLDGPGFGHDAASAGSARVTVTSGLRIRISTVRPRGASQISSRRTASAIEVLQASSSDRIRRVARCSASSSKRSRWVS